MSSTTATSRLLAPAGTGAGCRRHHRQPFAVQASFSSSSRLSPQAPCPQVPGESQLQRRQLLSLSLLAPAAALLAAAPAALAEEAPPAAAPAPAPAAAPASAVYTDSEDKFSIAVPAGWSQGIGSIGDAGTLTSNQARFSNAAGLRRVVAFFPEGKPDVSVAITIQFIAADFTSLGSFGTATNFAEGVVNKMDNSYLLRLPEWQRRREGPVQVAKLLDAREVSKQQYVFSYTLQKEGEAARTVYQQVAMGNTGRYNKLFTVNASCTAADLAQYGPVLQKMVASFQPPAAAAV